MVAVWASPCLESSWRISHLGKNPVKGGRPPRERRIRGVREAKTGALAQLVARALMVWELFDLNSRNVEVVMAM